MRWSFWALILGLARAQYSDPQAINTSVSLDFDLELPAYSPLVRYRNAPGQLDWQLRLNGAVYNLTNTTKQVNGSVSYRLGPNPGLGSQLVLPLVGRSVLIAGDVSAEYRADPWFAYMPGYDSNSTSNETFDGVTRKELGAFSRQAVYLAPREPGAGTVDILGIKVGTGMNTSASSLVKVPTSYVPFVVDGQPNPALSYTGQWVVSPTPAGPATLLSVPLGNDGSFGEIPRIIITVPAGTAFLVVNGTARNGAGTLSVVWDLATPDLVLDLNPPNPTNATDAQEGQLALAVSAFAAPAQVVYYAVLDTSATYAMTLAPNRPNDDLARVDLQSVTFYSGSRDPKPPFTLKTAEEFPTGNGMSSFQDGALGGEAKSDLNVGAIVGGVIGGVAFLALLAGILVWRRRKASAQYTRRPHFEIEPTPPRSGTPPAEAKVTPFEHAHATLPVAVLDSSRKSRPDSADYETEATRGSMEATGSSPRDTVNPTIPTSLLPASSTSAEASEQHPTFMASATATRAENATASPGPIDQITGYDAHKAALLSSPHSQQLRSSPSLNPARPASPARSLTVLPNDAEKRTASGASASTLAPGPTQTSRSSTPEGPTHEVDAGLLPPMYDPSWRRPSYKP